MGMKRTRGGMVSGAATAGVAAAMLLTTCSVSSFTAFTRIHGPRTVPHMNAAAHRPPRARSAVATMSTNTAAVPAAKGAPNAYDEFDEDLPVAADYRTTPTASKVVSTYTTDSTQSGSNLYGDYTEWVGEEAGMATEYRAPVLNYYMEVRSNLTNTLGRAPTVDEWAYCLNMAVNDLKTDIVRSQSVRSELVRKHMGLVIAIAKHHRGRGLSFQDLVQEGSCGLIKAAERFDPTRGYVFSTYARHWIRQFMSRALANNSRMIRLPARVHEKVQTVSRIASDLQSDLGREPTVDEIVRRTGLDAKSVQRYRKAAVRVRSWEEGSDQRRKGLEGEVLGIKEGIMDDSPMPQELVEGSMLSQDLRSVVDQLPQLERDVISLRYGLNDGTPKTITEVINSLRSGNPAEEYCSSRVKSAERRAFRKLRKPMTKSMLKRTIAGAEADEPVDWCMIYPSAAPAKPVS
uniref:RNA polymerase sigma-70 domain-containing protein n=1 Tax=Florenciella parvula TaxID=236787 RepID=A0A7S2CAM9_9STRA|mmetsp:Transcript_26452/g.54479  ORF Transcript_26452/g.54479 Transcript_26452/m.54479 type:complete len:460 (+) Transcript_26452:62-1441(+)